MKTLWVFVGIFLGCSSGPGLRPRTYSNFDKKCEISKLSWNGNKEECYCKIVGKNEQNEIIVYVPIPEKNCK